MSHSTPEQPTFGEHDESDALPSNAIAAAELDDLQDRKDLCCSSRVRPPLSVTRSVFEAADAAATFCPVLDSNFVLLLESLHRARVAEAPKARLDFFVEQICFVEHIFLRGQEKKWCPWRRSKR